MAEKIGETGATEVSVTTSFRGVPMVIISEQGDSSRKVMFPAHQVREIVELLAKTNLWPPHADPTLVKVIKQGRTKARVGDAGMGELPEIAEARRIPEA